MGIKRLYLLVCHFVDYLWDSTGIRYPVKTIFRGMLYLKVFALPDFTEVYTPQMHTVNL